MADDNLGERIYQGLGGDSLGGDGALVALFSELAPDLGEVMWAVAWARETPEQRARLVDILTEAQRVADPGPEDELVAAAASAVATLRGAALKYAVPDPPKD